MLQRKEGQMKIVVLGFGHMGSWIAQELSSNNQVAVFDKDQKKLRNLHNLKRLESVAQIKNFAPQMLINVVSLPFTKSVFDEVLGYLHKDCIICDLASVKSGLGQYYKDSEKKFVSVHPMFGPTFANVEDLKNENMIIIKESCQLGKDFFRDFANKLGMRIFEYTFQEHDDEVAYSLGVPFSASLVFASCIDQIDAPGTTYRRHLKTAKGVLSEDDYLLSEILFNSRVIPQIEKINSRLSYLTHIIRSKNSKIMIEFLNDLRKNIGLH